ncbi:TetR/AcrR family transcriptional regulator [Actinomyces ruminicola]|uniref:Transcriptional regulator, TetR family n=1 Tax=Actinomyces ruminicola TaxID=332524 RepID=A0A1G9ZL97_9ACTO|nr:TetR/AcrR family transcriptional regulator [Actinomyces ruminicola]SDN21855.1 transcriptional regulator, TetR family [Actinomyces ruminicola]
MARLEDSAAPLKDAMGNALLELMQNKPLKKISAGEIASRAGLGRVTYFRHFSSKEEVLAYKYRAAWLDFAARHWYDETDDRANAIALFRFCLQVRDINDVVYGAGQESILLDTVLAALDGEAPARAAGRTPSGASTVDPRTQYVRRFKAYGLFGLIDDWIRGGYHRSPEDMAAEYINCLSPEIESRGHRGGGRRTGGRAARMRRLQRIRENATRQDPRRHMTP